VLGRLLKEPALGAEPGVREHGVDAAEGIQGSLHERLVVRPFGDVAAHRRRLAVPAELSGQVPDSLLAPRGQDEAIPGLGGSPGGCGTDPARGAGDE
jgi:hypothetical protein